MSHGRFVEGLRCKPLSLLKKYNTELQRQYALFFFLGKDAWKCLVNYDLLCSSLDGKIVSHRRDYLFDYMDRLNILNYKLQ